MLSLERATPNSLLHGAPRVSEYGARRALVHFPHRPLQLVCSSRNPGKPRGPLWRGRNLSNESLQAVQELKRAKGNHASVLTVLNTKISRLLKPDLVAVLGELQRQDECELALQIFDVVRKEIWYKPDVVLYVDMINTLGRNNLIEDVEKLTIFSREEGIQPDSRFYTAVIGANLRSGKIPKAMEVYDEMKKNGCFPSELTYGILLKGLHDSGEVDLAIALEAEYEAAIKYPRQGVTMS